MRTCWLSVALLATVVSGCGDAAESAADATPAARADATATTVPDGGLGERDGGSADASGIVCASSLTELIGWQLDGKHILASSSSEFTCENSGACYEAVMIFTDGSAQFQNLDLQGNLLQCESLPASPSSELASIQSAIDDINADRGEAQLLEEITCGNQDSAAPDYAVDSYRARIDSSLTQLPIVLSNHSCRGAAASPPIKRALDRYWGLAPRMLGN